MTEKRFHKGDWSNNICEVYDDENYIGGVQLDCADEFIDLLNSLNEENKQLKQRNNNQAKRLDNLYNLIEKKDWRTLTDIIDDFQRCEEQLQKEWGCYCE